jgi:2-polyprenyl-6-methoxyphenol hydroxylase-like FAD-dependent oxidoreductase
VSILGAVLSYSILQQALDLIGSADALVERGVKHSTMNYYDRSYTRLMGVDFNGLIGKTRFPFCLNLPQHITESILTQKLKDAGVSIFRPYKAVGMQENSKDSRLVDVSFENGQSITAQYVVGADGSQSAVRTWIPLKAILMVNCDG